jgi:hypothetical protein
VQIRLDPGGGGRANADTFTHTQWITMQGDIPR